MTSDCDLLDGVFRCVALAISKVTDDWEAISDHAAGDHAAFLHLKVVYLADPRATKFNRTKGHSDSTLGQAHNSRKLPVALLQPMYAHIPS